MKGAALMGFIKFLITVPLLIVIFTFAIVNNDLATFDLWPFGINITVSLSVVIVFLLFVGFVLGKIYAWMSYSDVRHALRAQKKQNKILSKEQEKLNKEVQNLNESLNDNLADIKELKTQLPKKTFKERIKSFFSSSSKKESN